METELFRIRLAEETNEGADNFFSSAINDFDEESSDSIPTVSDLIKDLAQMSGVKEQDVSIKAYFKVPFQKVPDLVQKRLVVVKRGFAYVPAAMKPVIIVNQFKENLIYALELTAKALPNMDEDDRLDPILASISRQYITTSATYGATNANGLITHADIDSLVPNHFPLCMQTLHKTLRTEGHLKHSARLQYGLFIKGIGMSMDEALVFWRKAFMKMNDDQFQKGGYAYSIRHNYGMEGKRADYAPFNCGSHIKSLYN